MKVIWDTLLIFLSAIQDGYMPIGTQRRFQKVINVLCLKHISFVIFNHHFYLVNLNTFGAVPAGNKKKKREIPLKRAKRKPNKNLFCKSPKLSWKGQSLFCWSRHIFEINAPLPLFLQRRLFKQAFILWLMPVYGTEITGLNVTFNFLIHKTAQILFKSNNY